MCSQYGIVNNVLALINLHNMSFNRGLICHQPCKDHNYIQYISRKLFGSIMIKKDQNNRTLFGKAESKQILQ